MVMIMATAIQKTKKAAVTVRTGERWGVAREG